MRINAEAFKYEENSTLDPSSLSFSSDEEKLEGEGLELTLSDNVIEQNIATSQEVFHRYKVGMHIEGQGTLVSSSLDHLAAVLNTSVATDTISLNATITPTKMGLYAIQFETDLPSDASYAKETWTITGLNITGDTDINLNADDEYYLPVQFQSTSQSQLQISQA